MISKEQIKHYLFILAAVTSLTLGVFFALRALNENTKEEPKESNTTTIGEKVSDYYQQ